MALQYVGLNDFWLMSGHTTIDQDFAINKGNALCW